MHIKMAVCTSTLNNKALKIDKSILRKVQSIQLRTGVGMGARMRTRTGARTISAMAAIMMGIISLFCLNRHVNLHCPTLWWWWWWWRWWWEWWWEWWGRWEWWEWWAEESELRSLRSLRSEGMGEVLLLAVSTALISSFSSSTVSSFGETVLEMWSSMLEGLR